MRARNQSRRDDREAVAAVRARPIAAPPLPPLSQLEADALAQGERAAQRADEARAWLAARHGKP
jgi:hypothetical protein